MENKEAIIADLAEASKTLKDPLLGEDDFKDEIAAIDNAINFLENN